MTITFGYLLVVGPFHITSQQLTMFTSEIDITTLLLEYITYVHRLITTKLLKCTVKAPVFGTLNSAISNFQT